MHAVQDGRRTLNFDGDLIAEASSWVEGKPRWTELKLYRTTGGNYVLSRCGASALKGETNRERAEVCERPGGVVDLLYQKDDEGTWYLTVVARELLEAASLVDPLFSEATRVEMVD